MRRIMQIEEGPPRQNAMHMNKKSTSGHFLLAGCLKISENDILVARTNFKNKRKKMEKT